MLLDPSPLRNLIDRWAYGWASARGLAVAPIDGGVVVTVNDASRRLEYVATSPDEQQFAKLTALTTGRTDVWLTIFAADITPYRRAATTLDIAAEDETFMTCTIEPQQASRMVLIDSDESRSDAHLEIDGELASIGSVGIIGPDAIFDRIETMPRFRRRGHGRAVMSALSSVAYDRGARQGLLAASADGVHLYGSLGWVTAAPMISFTGRPAANP